MENSTRNESRKFTIALIYAAFIAGLCSIIYELLIATTVSYFLGDSVKYFSITIGIYMAAMGLGSFISKYINNNLVKKFILIEISLALIGGLSIPLLYFSYSLLDEFLPVYFSFTILIGFLIGLEIPFLTRLMESYNSLKINIANILTFDYLGALIATISFPFILLPFIGIYQSSLVFGLINISISIVVIITFYQSTFIHTAFFWISVLVAGILILMILFSNMTLGYWESSLYGDRITYSAQSPYQKIVLTQHADDTRLYLDGNLQFSSIDEYRYHEALVQIPLSLAPETTERVLLLGAGDGLAVRELLKHSDIKHIDLVDLDEKVIQLAKTNPYLSKINQNSLENEKVDITIDDAFIFLRKNHDLYDVIISDLPDPNNSALVRLYSKQFYQLINMNLKKDGIFIAQATSPYFARKAFWSIEATIRSGGFKHVYPYHVDVPSFGDWGFVLASKRQLKINSPEIDVSTRYLDERNFPHHFVFDKDIDKVNVSINNIDRPILLQYYLSGWQYYSN